MPLEGPRLIVGVSERAGSLGPESLVSPESSAKTLTTGANPDDSPSDTEYIEALIGLTGRSIPRLDEFRIGLIGRETWTKEPELRPFTAGPGGGGPTKPTGTGCSVRRGWAAEDNGAAMPGLIGGSVGVDVLFCVLVL